MGMADGNVFAMACVSSFDVARDFYGGTLGLNQVDENPGGIAYECGDGRIFVYVSEENAGSGTATVATWAVDDVTAVVEELSSKGVTFEHYDMPGMERDGDVHKFGGNDEFQNAWFKDPDGNILGLVSGDM